MKNIFLKILPYISGILGLLMAFSIYNRALTYGFLLAIFAIYVLRQQKPLKFIVVGLFILLAILILMVFFIKSDSSFGRMLIYKISFQIFRDNWFLGIGLGNFKKVYLCQQASYFSKGNYSNKELLLADNTHYAFNDYWQFIIETGIIGIVVLSLLVYFLSTLFKDFSHKKYQVVTSNIALLLVAVLTAAIFTHIFEKLICQAVIVLSVAYLYFLGSHKRWIKAITISIFLILLLNIGVKGIEGYRTRQNYKTALNLSIAGLKNECKAELLKMYPINDHKRAVLYLQTLIFSYDLKNEKEIIALLAQYPNANTYKLLGDFYLLNNKLKAAENAYLMSINMVPNRFVPRQSLMRLYISQKKNTEAEVVARNIVSLNIKVDSYQVKSIKLEATNFLNNQNRNL